MESRQLPATAGGAIALQKIDGKFIFIYQQTLVSLTKYDTFPVLAESWIGPCFQYLALQDSFYLQTDLWNAKEKTCNYLLHLQLITSFKSALNCFLDVLPSSRLRRTNIYRRLSMHTTFRQYFLI